MNKKEMFKIETVMNQKKNPKIVQKFGFEQIKNMMINYFKIIWQNIYKVMNLNLNFQYRNKKKKNNYIILRLILL